jgi:hypothetical protein
VTFERCHPRDLPDERGIPLSRYYGPRIIGNPHKLKGAEEKIEGIIRGWARLIIARRGVFQGRRRAVQVTDRCPRSPLSDPHHPQTIFIYDFGGCI